MVLFMYWFIYSVILTYLNLTIVCIWSVETLHFRYSQLDQENLLEYISQWTKDNPDDRFTCISASQGSSDADDMLENVEQDNDDEVYSTRNAPISTSFFFCHMSKYQRHLLKRLLFTYFIFRL